MTRLLTPIFLLALASACGRIDRQAFQELDKAGRAVAVALEGRTALPRYRQLMAVYSAELIAARRKIRSSGDRALLTEYEAAGSTMQDLLAVWERRDEHDTELLPIAEELPARLKVEYDLPVNTNAPPSIYASEAMRAMADSARARLQQASERLNQ